MLRPTLNETRKFLVVETETRQDWTEVVKTETFSRVLLYSGIALVAMDFATLSPVEKNHNGLGQSSGIIIRRVTPPHPTIADV